ncbi:hypothetical protein BTO32_14750 [Marinobacter lutaoensis]|uniref:Uncharacterized protein n=1 Tax=Marinobacter lutaoensis TaxID=135739 RepID=A0A1V2DPP2_9GAMM|nr:hypothetical protein [Marinobacter lutaoensis]ONF42470.1 hypothetical protein BTO32_14750 [Marinobacter lutaoensis]
MLDIIGQAKEKGRERNKVRTTVFKLEKYIINKDNPGESRMIGYDMYAKDENGVPKRVEVKHINEKTQGITDFANPGAMMHTAPGGLIRLSQYRVAGDGTYLTSHMQRIRRDEGPKISASQDKYDIGYMKGWVKIYPKREPDGKLTIFERRGRLFHRADAMVIPEDAQETLVNFGGDNFEQEVKQALNRAIDNAPKGTQPILMVRMPGKLEADEIRIPNLKVEADKSITLLPKEEMIALAMKNGKLANNYFPVHEAAKQGGQVAQVQFVPGFSMQAIGLKWDGKSMQKNPETGLEEPRYTERSLIEEFISETAQRHQLPPEPGSDKVRYVIDDGAPQYAFGVLSYRIKQVEPGEYANADLDTFGRDRGAEIIVSPNAGLDVKPNPYAPAVSTQQSVNQAPKTEPQVKPAVSAPVQQAPQPAPSAQTTAQSQPVSEKTQLIEEEVAEPEEAADFGIDDFDDPAFDNIDMDDIEQQLSAQQL